MIWSPNSQWDEVYGPAELSAAADRREIRDSVKLASASERLPSPIPVSLAQSMRKKIAVRQFEANVVLMLVASSSMAAVVLTLFASVLT